MAPSKRPNIANPIEDTRYVSEKTIFRVADPRIDDAEWPVFELRDVIVLDKTRRYLRNLLRIEETGPYIVRGKVYCDMSDRSQVAQLLQPKHFKPVDIEIEASSMSIGLDDFDTGENGEDVSGSVIWAKSYYGFFRITTPANSYKILYNHSLEAITLYYSVMSVYEEHSLSKGNKRSQSTGKIKVIDMVLFQVLLKYAVMIGDGCILEDVINRCIIHAPFLSSQFKFETTFDWEHTSFQKFVKAQIGHGHAWEQSHLENLIPDPESAGDPRSTQILKPVFISETQSPLEDPFSENPEPSPTEVTKHIIAGKHIVYEPQWFKTYIAQDVSADKVMAVRPGKSNHNSQVKRESSVTSFKTNSTPAQALYKILPKMLGRRRIGSATFKSVSRVIWAECSVPTRKDVDDILVYISKDLVYLMDTDPEWRDVWRRTKFYDELLNAEDPDEASLKEIENMVTYLHWRKAPTRLNIGTKRPFDDTRLYMGGKTSSLRPTKRAATNSETESLRGKSATPSSSNRQRLSTKPVKDVAVISLEDDEYDEFAAFRREEQEPEPKSSTSESENEEAPMDSMVRLVIRSVPMPTAEPNSPDGSWICTAQGCRHIVEPEDDNVVFEERVREHLIQHEKKDSRIKLAMTESKGHAISHLLEKIKNASGENLSTGIEESQPAPVKRRFMVM